MIRLKGYYTGHPAWVQLIILLLLLLAGTILSVSLGMGIFFLACGYSADILRHPDMLRLNQLLSAAGTFVLPSLGVAWLCSEQPKKFLSLGKAPGLYILLLTCVGMLLLSPLITLTDWWNQQLTLSGFLEPLEQWMRRQEDNAGQMIDIFLAGRDMLSILFNLLVIAVMAGIGEEFFFRGALQRILSGWKLNHHAVIWLTAILFSLFHVQFFGFVPRTLLGAFFGYLLYWSGNIWIPVFAHTIHNAIGVLTMSSGRLSQNTYLTGELVPEQILPYLILATVAFFFFLLLMRVLRRRLRAVRD